MRGMSNEGYEIIIRDDGVYILQTEEYRFHLDEKTHVEKIGRLINENEQLKQLLDYADDLIQSYMSVHNRDEWENVKKNIKGDVE